MNILLTGGSGFIGKNILGSFLVDKYNILAPSHKELELLDEDAVTSYFRENNVDVIIHCAMKPGHRNAKDPQNILYSNLRIFFNIASNVYSKQRMIFLSSGLVYDMRYYMPKMKEEYYGMHIPMDESGFSKYIAAKYIENTDNIVELRVFGVFGKYEDYEIRFISNAICKTLYDLPITIEQNRKFDYIYINDLIFVIDYFMKNNFEYKAYNVTSDNSIELLTLAEKIRRISGKQVPIKIAQEGMGVEYSGDNSRLKGEINNLKFTDMDTAIKELYDWYSSNKHNINPDLLLVDK